ncbi:putative protease inhibitor [Coniochaeta ligniaria NRRL 30616]|uniref:Putative protease inhibitor n=1 Tax=Coniochaeta ligniaria NRRL 30616 TaxID=1408157 RepID=A0A1J7JUT0_9PEZI|nr:putative protease inhibitor [Coniochaeta ligniaria NRRL 30616]
MPANESVKKALSLIEGDKSKVLGLKVGSTTVAEPGQYIAKADAQSAPELSFPGASPSATYLVIGLDIDAPFPSFDVLGPILHWIQPGLKADSDSGTLKETEPFVADYIGPAPPPPSSPHRYIFFLYEQPAGFEGSRYAPKDGAKLGVWSRMRASLDDLEKEYKLGPVLAVNYFTSN